MNLSHKYQGWFLSKLPQNAKKLRRELYGVALINQRFLKGILRGSL